MTVSKVLRQFALEAGSQGNLAGLVGIDQSTVSRDIAGRAVPPGRICQYASIMDETWRGRLLATWLRETFGPEILSTLMDKKGRVQYDAAGYAAQLDADTRAALDYLASRCAADAELATTLRRLAGHLGWDEGQGG